MGDAALFVKLHIAHKSKTPAVADIDDFFFFKSQMRIGHTKPFWYSLCAGIFIFYTFLYPFFSWWGDNFPFLPPIAPHISILSFVSESAGRQSPFSASHRPDTLTSILCFRTSGAMTPPLSPLLPRTTTKKRESRSFPGILSFHIQISCTDPQLPAQTVSR